MCRGVSHTPFTAANISAEKLVTKRCFVRKCLCRYCFHLRSSGGRMRYAPRFSCDAETTIFSHHGLRNCFTIKDEFANGKPSSAGHQGYFRDWEPWFEIRAKYIFHLRKEDCFLRKTAIATAMEVDHLAQTASAFAEMRLSLRQSGICKRRNDIVPCANAHRIC